MKKPGGKWQGRKAPEGASEKARKTLAQVRDAIRQAEPDRPAVVFESDIDNRPRYATRFPRLNAQLNGGIAEGAVLELYGLPDCGKSSTALALAADIQRQAPTGRQAVGLVNFEVVFSYPWARTLGLDTTEQGSEPRFLNLEPSCLEEGVARGIEIMETGQLSCLIIDSVFAADSRDGSAAIRAWNNPDAKGAGQSLEARKWGEAWTTIKGVARRTGTVVIAVGQAREDRTAPPRSGFMPTPLKSTRGSALAFFSHVRFEMRASRVNPEEFPGRDGQNVRFRTVKNKTSSLATARAPVQYRLFRGEGFDLAGDLLDIALESGTIQAGGGGNFTVLGGPDGCPDRIRGREKVETAIRQDGRFRAWLEEGAKNHLARTLAPEKPIEGDQAGDQQEPQEQA